MTHTFPLSTYYQNTPLLMDRSDHIAIQTSKMSHADNLTTKFSRAIVPAINTLKRFPKKSCQSQLIFAFTRQDAIVIQFKDTTAATSFAKEFEVTSNWNF